MLHNFSTSRLLANLLLALWLAIPVAAQDATQDATQDPAKDPAKDPTPESPPVKPGQLVPRLPLVASAPVRAEWTIQLSADLAVPAVRPGQATPVALVASESRTANSIEFSKDAVTKAYRLRTRWNDGDTEDEWIVAGSHVAERASHHGLYIVGNESSAARELPLSDFPELAWVDMSHYRGVKLLNGKKTFFFSVQFDQKRLTGEQAQLMAFSKRSDPKATPTKIFRPKVQEVTLYLDTISQLPLLYNDGMILRRYHFTQPSEERLQPPAKIVEFLRARNEALRIRLTPPAGPGSL